MHTYVLYIVYICGLLVSDREIWKHLDKVFEQMSLMLNYINHDKTTNVSDAV